VSKIRGQAPTSLDDPSAVAERVDAQLAQWIKAGGTVRIDRDDPALSARRN
jgi:alanyl-tRNA synthetase